MTDMYNAELYHYGVPGMRWGVSRASKRLSKATTKKQYDRANKKLERHYTKSARELKALRRERPALDDRLDSATRIDKNKAAEYQSRANAEYRKAAKYNRRANRLISTQGLRDYNAYKSARLESRADVLDAKAKEYKSNYEYAQSRVERNEALQKAYRQGMADIDAARIAQGKRYVQLPETRPKRKKKKKKK